jgi:hypothetical protein
VEKWYLLKLFQEWEGKGVKENGRGVNSSMIYCKNFYKCHSVPPPSTTIKNKRKKKESFVQLPCNIPEFLLVSEKFGFS